MAARTPCAKLAPTQENGPGEAVTSRGQTPKELASMQDQSTQPFPAQTTVNSTRVVHVKDAVPGAVYIGRAMPRQGLKASPFANPYKIGAPSYQSGGISTRDMMSRTTVIERYERDLQGPKRHLLAQLPELRGKPLACWCRHEGEALDYERNLCHGDVLAIWLDFYTDDELRAMAVQP